MTTTNSRERAKELAASIHAWRQENIPGYSATNWAGENLPDEDYDAQYKHPTKELWRVPIDPENCLVLQIEETTEDWIRNDDINP